MKTRTFTQLLLISLLMLCSTGANAQKWLKSLEKVADGIVKTADALDKIIPADDQDSSDDQQYSDNHSNDSQVPVKFVSCIRNGEDVTLNFTIGNYTGRDIELGKFGYVGSPIDVIKESTAITDDAGYNYRLSSATIGGVTERRMLSDSPSIERKFRLNNGTTVYGSAMVKRVAASATSFQVFKITCYNNTGNGYYSNITRVFTFRNVPILTLEDIARLEREREQREFEKKLAKADAGDAEAQYAVGIHYYNNEDNARAINYFTRSAEQGYADALGELAEDYYYGFVGLDVDHNKALAYAQQGVTKGSLVSYTVLGRMCRHGEVVDKDINKAIEYLTYAANRDNSDAQCELGWLYASVDKPLSAQWHKRSADNGNINGIRETANNYFLGWGVTVNRELALDYALKGVAKNDKECMYYAGWIYRNSEGTKQNLPKAKELLAKSAELGSANGCRELAYYYQLNAGDNLKAIDYLNRAIALGDTQSFHFLAQMHEQGLGTLKNPTKAKELYTRSAESGNASSQYKLGVMAKASSDFNGAFKWFSKSADGGLSEAQYELGLAYYYAKGTVKNSKKSAEYIEKAYKQGNKDAEKVWNSLQLWKYL